MRSVATGPLSAGEVTLAGLADGRAVVVVARTLQPLGSMAEARQRFGDRDWRDSDDRQKRAFFEVAGPMLRAWSLMVPA